MPGIFKKPFFIVPSINFPPSSFTVTLISGLLSFMRLPFYTMLVCLLPVLSLSAQPAVYLRIQPIGCDTIFLKKQVSWPARFADSTALQEGLRQLISKLQYQSFLEASVDSLSVQDSTWTAFLYPGPPYRWASLRNGNVDPAWLSQTGFRERLFQRKPFLAAEWGQLNEQLLGVAEDNGYPFASIQLDSLRIAGDQITARLLLQKNRLILLDGIQLKGNLKLSDAYLSNYLGLKKGSPYSKSRILKISNRLRELPFVQELQPATLTFKGDLAKVNLYIDKKKASRFDFILGLLPNNNTQGATRFQLTGTLTADLQNPFGLGEKIYVEFQQLRPQTQQLDLRFAYPYLLNLPFGLDTRFELYKRDTTHLDISYDLGIQYFFEGGSYLKVFWNNTTSTLLSLNSAQLLAQQPHALPENLDFRNATFGLESSLQRLDYRFNPRKGWSIWARAGAGIKTIRKNNDILQLSDPTDPTFDFGTLYDSLDLRSYQYKLDLKLEGFLPLFKRSTLRLALQGGSVFSKQSISRNEQYRIGGNRLLRGFDEESLFATRYAVATLEYRLLTGRNAFLSLFGDYGYLDNTTRSVRLFDRPLGLGAGITFETGVGVFGISLAVGKQQNNPFDFRSVKTHLGYVSYF